MQEGLKLCGANSYTSRLFDQMSREPKSNNRVFLLTKQLRKSVIAYPQNEHNRLIFNKCIIYLFNAFWSKSCSRSEFIPQQSKSENVKNTYKMAENHTHQS
jgi:hypothetical protein